MPIGNLKFVGPVPVDDSKVRDFIEKYVYVPPTAAGTDEECIIDRILRITSGLNPLQIDSVTYIPAAAVTLNSGNYVTLTLYNRYSDGSGTDVLATLVLNGVSPTTAAAYVQQTFTLNTGIRAPQHDDVLTLKVTHGGSGQILPNGALRIRYIA